MNTETNNSVVRDLALSSSMVEGHAPTPDGKLFPVLFAHNSLTQVDMSKYMDAPLHLQADQSFSTVESFIEYVNSFSDGQTPMLKGYPESNGRIFKATIDYHSPGSPSFCRHKAFLHVEHSAQWDVWCRNQKNRMSQRAFKHFIEDNIEDIQSPDSATLLQQITDTKVDTATDTRSSVKDDGDSVSGSASKKLVSGTPEPLELALKPWKCMETYMSITARVYSHINDSGRVEFSYQLINAEDALEKKFNDYREQISAGTGFAVYV